MNQELLQILKKNLNQLLEKGIFENAEIILFGMNTPGDRVIQFLSAKGYQVRGIVDNNQSNHGKRLMGVPVYSPEVLRKPRIKNLVVLICSKYYAEMKKQLESMGYRENQHIFQILEMAQGVQISDSLDAWSRSVADMRSSISTLKKIFDKYIDNAFFLLCPVCANGDVYIISSLMQAYQQKKTQKKCVLVLVGNIGKKVAGIFDVDSVEVVTQEDMEKMVMAYRFLGKEIPVKIMHPSYYYFQIFSNMEGYKKLNFMDFMAAGVLGMKQPYPVGKECLKSEERIFSGKEVILAPYANSVPDFPLSFWEELTKKLKERGYIVYTNGDGEIEPSIKGTEPIFLPIDEMSCVMNQCAAFIAIRNGLCDIVAGSSCRKIILYPDKAVRFGELKEYYGLKNMGLMKEGIELVYTEQQAECVQKEILDFLQDNI